MFVINILALFYCFIAGKELIKESFTKNVEYVKPKHPNYREPHRHKDGTILIDNTLSYELDKKKYGAVMAIQWAKEGKYNLYGAELEAEKERCKQNIKNIMPV